MDSMSFQLQGVRSPDLLVTVMGLIALTLVAFGITRLLRNARRDGLMCIAAAAPSVLVLILAGRLEMGAWMLLLGIQVALAVAVFYAAVYAYLGRRRVAILMAMRCAAILALLLILFKPAVSVTPNIESYKPYLPILVDRSSSMATADQGGNGDRYTQALRMLSSQQERLKQYFRPTYYHFATGLAGVESLDDLTRLEPKGPTSESTNIAMAVEQVAAKHKGDNLAGMLLMTDGIHNDPAGEPKDAAAAAGLPIYAIGVGSRSEQETGRRNLQLVSVDAPFEVIKNNVATVTVTVKATGFPNTANEVQLVEDGNVVASAPLMTDKGAAIIPLDVKWTPRDAGGKVKVADDDARKRSEVRRLKVVVPGLSGETSAEDNQGELHVLVNEPRIRVLYVEGTIRPEYKFLLRTLNIDVNVQFMSLVRVRKNEFSAYGTVGGRTLNDLPKTDEDFRLFDVIILGDIDATYFSKEQLARLKQFVKDGGGLLMLGGHNSFGPGGYEGTDVEALLPVVTGSRNQPQETTPFVPMLTAEGQKHPLFEGIADYFTGPENQPPKPELPKLPDLQGCVTVVGPKPLANILAVHPTRRNEQGPLIVLAVQQYGAGRSAAFTCDTTWQWFMPMQSKGDESPYRLFWGQMIRWLSNIQTKNKSATPSVVLRMDSPYVQAGKGVRVLVRVQDDKGRASDTANVLCSLTPAGGGEAESFNMVSRKSGGMFEVNLERLKEGKYVLRADARNQENQSLGFDEMNLIVAPHSAELDQLARNESLLQTISEQTRGRYADIAGLPEIIDQIIDRQKGRMAGIPKTDSYRLYDFTLLFLVFVALLTGEWLLRRRWQLQ